MSARFEGSFGGDAARISAAAVMECNICWSVYDPAEGDQARQIPPGTPFLALPEDWRCPDCDGARDQFMVLDDPGAPAEAPRPLDRVALAAAGFEAAFREIWNAKMRDVPLCNRALHVEAVGFRDWDGRSLGIVVAPWFMNLMLGSAEGEDWGGLTPGAKEIIEFPSGAYEFTHNVRDGAGGYKVCSLFSPMSDFATQDEARDVARAAMVALFDPANRDRSNAGGEGLSASPSEPSRRTLLTGGAAP